MYAGESDIWLMVGAVALVVLLLLWLLVPFVLLSISAKLSRLIEIAERAPIHRREPVVGRDVIRCGDCGAENLQGGKYCTQCQSELNRRVA